MTNLNVERALSTESQELIETTVHDAVGEILDESFDEIQDAIVCRVLKRLQMATYEKQDSKQEKACCGKHSDHSKMFDPIAGP